MPRLIDRPVTVAAEGNLPKKIEEYSGHAASGETRASIAKMRSPEGWREPGQRPEFQEISLVLHGTLRVEHAGGHMDVHAGQAVIAQPGEWVRYSTPHRGGAEYIAVCLPAFSPHTVHRDSE